MFNQALALELQPTESVLDGWLHAFGVYYPRRNAVEHQHSPWSRAVILAKRKNESIIDRFGAIIAAHLEPLLQTGQFYLIAPVPGEPESERFLFNGFDKTPTELLADGIQARLSDGTRVRVVQLLVQVRHKSKRQHQCLNLAERMANVRNLYALKPGVVLAGEGVILVDDVITSGATMAACAQVLRQAGVKEIMGVALAQTVRLRPPDLQAASLAGSCA